MKITDSGECPQERGRRMRPSRHEQLRDLAYVEEREFRMILDHALELYVTKTYGKQYEGK